jgi:F0F1-type ATP synthase assembly protein I
MAAIIGIFTYAGTWCDSYFETTKPYFTVIFSLIGVAGGLYTSLKDFLK